MALLNESIMNERKIILTMRFAIIFLIGALSIQCGSFQGVSYYDSDGIYNSRKDTRTAPNRPARQPLSQQEEKQPPKYSGEVIMKTIFKTSG